MLISLLFLVVAYGTCQLQLIAQEPAQDSNRQHELVLELRALPHSKTIDSLDPGLTISNDGATLVLRRWPAADLEKCLSIVVRLSGVKKLEFDKCELTCTSFEFLSRISELEELSIHECFGRGDERSMVSPCFLRLSSLKNLRAISLYENNPFISAKSFAAILPSFEKLQRLEVTHMFKWGRENGDGSLTLRALSQIASEDREIPLMIRPLQMSREFDKALDEIAKDSKSMIFVERR